MKRIQIAGTVCAVLLAAGTAAAQAPKYNRKTKDIKVEQTERTKKLAPKQGEKAAAPEPTITADKFFKVQGEIQGDLDELIKTYKEQLADTPPNNPLFIDYGFRLAEAFAQKQRFHHGQRMDAVLKADQLKPGPEKDKLAAEAKKAQSLEVDALKNAISAYKALIDNPQIDKFQRGDEVIFYYAYTLQQAGRPELAGDAYKALLKKFQGSRFVPDAYLYFADRYFEDRDLGNAEAFYTKVLQFPKSPIYPYAVYKRGWTYYNEKRIDEASRAMRETIRLTNGDKMYSAMNKAAKKDFVRFYAESGAPVNVAYQAFQGIDKTDYAFTMYGFLGGYYMDEGKADNAIYVYHHMISMKPKDVLVCEWQYNIARATMSIGNNQDKIRELSNLVKLYTSVKKWTPPMPDQQLTDCRENAAGVTGELAMLWHAEGLKTLNFETLGNAEDLYHVYLDNFPDAENALTMQVNYAELLWSRAAMEKDSKMQPKRWEATAAEHSKVVNWPGVSEAQRKDSAYATVLAWKNALAVDVAANPPAQVADADLSKPEPIPDKEQQMLKAFKVYLTYITDEKDTERTAIEFLTGRLYWYHRHWDEAIPLLADVVTKHPEDETSQFAANILLDSLNKAGRYDELQEWVTRLHENAKLMAAHPSLKGDLDSLYVQGVRRKAEQAEKSGDFRTCGFSYDKLQKENPNDPKINEILYNAAICFKKAKMIGYAITFRQHLVDRPNADKDSFAQKAQLYLGDDFSSIAWYDKAADQYETYASKFAGEKDAAAALAYATFYRTGLGMDDKAIKDTELYVKTFSKKEPREAANAFYSIANIYEKNNDTKNFVAHLENYIRQWGDKGGVDVEIAAHVRAGEVLWKQSCPVKGEKGSCIEIKRERALRDTSRAGKHKARVTQTQCGDVSKNKLTVYDRKPAQVKEAQEHFRKAIALWKANGPSKITGKDESDKNVRTADTIRWVAAANFYLGEADYEKFLALKFPTNLTFDDDKPAKKKDSLKRFTKWLEDKKKLAAQLSAQYGGIVDTATSGGININAAQWAIASAARIGQVLQNFSDALFTAEIPKEVQAHQDSVDAYCDQLTNEADPLEKKSIEAFSFCLDSSNKLNWFNEWSQLCESELAQIRPQDFPAAGEIRAQPYNVPVSLDTQSIVASEPVKAAAEAKGTN